MPINLATPVTGGAQTGLTSPTYTMISDIAPDINGKQWAVSALGGTQTEVVVHSATAPFTITFVRPKAFKTYIPNGSGNNSAKGKNVWNIIIRKGVRTLNETTMLRNDVALITMQLAIPVGSEVLDPANLRAMFSLAIGGLNQVSASLGDTVVTGTL